MKKKRLWLLNIFLILSVLFCILVFLAHSRNWIRKDGAHLGILSGFYYSELSYDSISSVEWTTQVPQLPREHGFSGGPVEKGVFIDSLNPDRPVRIYIDDWTKRKIRIRQRDSSVLYLNLPDSLETDELYQFLHQQIKKGMINAEKNPVSD